MPLLEENGFRPDLDSIAAAKNAKMMFINYPNNPTGSVMDRDELERIVEFAKENSIIVCYDNAYSEITFDGYRAPSILQVDGGKDVAVEFHSCSKTFGMTGDRIGFAVGNSQIIDGFLKVKKQVDSGPPLYTQKVAVKALGSYVNGEPPQYVKSIAKTYAERRDELVNGLRALGLKCEKPLATFYVWMKCEGSSMQFVSRMLDAGVVTTPGTGFGEYGEGYVRFSVTQPKQKIREACERIARTL